MMLLVLHNGKSISAAKGLGATNGLGKEINSLHDGLYIYYKQLATPATQCDTWQHTL